MYPPRSLDPGSGRVGEEKEEGGREGEWKKAKKHARASNIVQCNQTERRKEEDDRSSLLISSQFQVSRQVSGCCQKRTRGRGIRKRRSHPDIFTPSRSLIFARLSPNILRVDNSGRRASRQTEDRKSSAVLGGMRPAN